VTPRRSTTPLVPPRFKFLGPHSRSIAAMCREVAPIASLKIELYPCVWARVFPTQHTGVASGNEEAVSASSLFLAVNVSSTECAVGYEGEACRDCTRPGYYRLGDACTPCPKAAGSVIGLLLVALGRYLFALVACAIKRSPLGPCSP
jgi:hypothetical protein